MMNKKIKTSWIQQQGQADCGVVCLASVIKYHGGEARLETLREQSGTSTQGTTLLGIYQAASEMGFDAKGFEADIENLKKIESPVILHVIIDEKSSHFVICYGYEEGKFIISDPAKGVSNYSENDLKTIWKSKALLQLNPNASFEKSEDSKGKKKKWMLSLVKEDYSILLTSLFLGILITVLGIATAVFSQKLIDEILPAKDSDKLMLGLVLLGVLLLARGLLGYLRGLFLIKQSRDFNNRIINKFYSSLLYLPKLFFDSRKTGELIARMNDTRRIQDTISYLFASIFINILVLIISSVFIFNYSNSVGYITIISIPLYGLLVWKFNQRIVASQKDVMAAYAKNEGNYIDTIQGIEVIKALNKEPMFEQITKNIYGFFQDRIFSLGRLNIAYFFWSEFIGVLLIISVISYTSFEVLNSQLMLGEMVAILSMVGGIIPSVSSLALSNIKLQEANVAFDRMYEFAGLASEKETESNTVLDNFRKLDLQNISFGFPGRGLLLKDVSFSISKGELVALIGESGSGKSTLFQIVQKFYKSSSGRIVINDNVLWNNVSAYNWRNQVATVAQEIKIFNTTLLDNICLGDVSKEANQVIKVCKQYGFDTFFEKFPQGYLTLLGEEGINLSGGQKQLVALARALYKKPQLLLLDEATSAMDRSTEQFVMNLLSQLKNEMAVLLITHRIHTASQADKIYVLEKGIISANGIPRELLDSDNFYSSSYRDLQSALIAR